jgi:hypothetical protein
MMKRHLTLFSLSVLAAAPLMAQEPYYPAYGYAPEPTYDNDQTTRQFNFNPGSVINNMPNPMSGMFNTNRGNDGYPAARYAPPAYPPVYGYPGYQTYQPPYPDYGYAPPAPAYPDYDAFYGQPLTQPAAVEPPPPAIQPPDYHAMPPAAQNYQPRFANPEQGENFRFRPLDGRAYPAPQTTPADLTGQQSDVLAPPAPSYQDTLPLAPLTYPPENPYTEPTTPVYRDPEPLAPLTYPQPPPYTESGSPLGYADPRTTSPDPEVQIRDTLIEQDPNLKFRPLDKPGYSSDLEE